MVIAGGHRVNDADCKDAIGSVTSKSLVCVIYNVIDYASLPWIAQGVNSHFDCGEDAVVLS